MDKLKAAFAWFRGQSDKLQRTVVCLLIGFVLGGITCRAWRKNVVDEAEPENRFGAIFKPEYTDRIVSQFRHPFFGDAGRKLVQQQERKTVILTEAYRQVTGKMFPAHYQIVGSCVGEGWSAGIEILQCVQIQLGNRQEYKPISAAAIYALAREVGKMLGGGDGAVPADAAKALLEIGCISCEQAGDDNGVGASNNGKLHGKLCADWGRRGLPQELRKLCDANKLGGVSRTRTPEEIEAALRNGYVVPVASSLGFEGNGGYKRDSHGFCKSGGTWGHQQLCAGFVLDAGGRGVHGFLIINSWSDRMPSGPKPEWMPDCGYLITVRDMQRLLAAGDAYAMSSFDGFPAQDLPLFIQAPIQRDLAIARRVLEFPIAW